MKTSIKRIKSFKPCLSSCVKLIAQLGKEFGEDEEFEVSSLIGGKNTIEDLIWFLRKEQKLRPLLELSVFCYDLAEVPKAEESDAAINLVKKWLADESSVTASEFSTAEAKAAAAYTLTAVCGDDINSVDPINVQVAYITYAVALTAAYAAVAVEYAQDDIFDYAVSRAAHAASAGCPYANTSKLEAKAVEIIDSIE